MKKVMIIGAGGYIATYLRSYLSRFKWFRYSLFHVSSKDALNYIQVLKPDIVIHTSWINSLLECEVNKEFARKINVENSIKIINEVEKLLYKNYKIKFVFISSDYVFSGDSGNYLETDKRNPTTYYGQTKVEVEDHLTSVLENYIIARTANVFSVGGKFFDFLCSSLEKENYVKVYSDRRFTPTYMRYFCECLEELIFNEFFGIIHIAGKQALSRYDFAISLARVMGKNSDFIVNSNAPEDSLILPDSSLNTSKLSSILFNYNPSIEKAFKHIFKYIDYPSFYSYDDRGFIRGIVQSNNIIWKEINYIESRADVVRGNHYHKVTLEGFYIISGKILVTLNGKDFIAEGGDSFYVEPGVVHAFTVLEDSRWINFLSKPMLGEKDIFK